VSTARSYPWIRIIPTGLVHLLWVLSRGGATDSGSTTSAGGPNCIRGSVDQAERPSFNSHEGCSPHRQPCLWARHSADRFQLKIHRETKELPVYALVVDKSGPKMKESAAGAQYSWRLGRGQWTVSRVSMTRLARSLTGAVGRTAVDLTGLTGDYDFTLEWTPEQASLPGRDSAAVPDLGVRLSSRRIRNSLGLNWNRESIRSKC
jgi:Protein of unknown function (DUF3738)